MRIQLYVSRGYREVWRQAREAAKADEVPISAFASEAVQEYLKRRRRALEKKVTDLA